MDELSLTLVQTPLHWQKKEDNFKLFENLLSEVEHTDLILLPEMFSTGFSMNPEDLWDEPKGKSLEWLRALAGRKSAAISGSVIVKDKGKYYNRLYFVEPNGDYRCYDKKHLFTLAGEEKVYSAGSEQLILEYQGWKLMPLICYDLRFPVWCRNTANVDLQYFVANWPERRSEAWKSLLKSRAIENMCFVAGVNRVGEDGNGVDHSGDSGVYDELGNLILELTPYRQRVESVTISRKRMLESRQRFRFLDDRDEFRLSS